MTGWTRRFAAFIAFLVLLHFTMRVGFGFGNGVPDFLTVTALLAARRLPTPWAVAVGVLLGAINDAFSLTGYGTTAIALGCVAALGGISRDFFEGDSPIFILFYLWLGVWLAEAIALVIGRDAVGGPVPWLLLRNIWLALWAAAAGLAALSLFRNFSGERA
jgi:hypothetical protein